MVSFMGIINNISNSKAKGTAEEQPRIIPGNMPSQENG